MTLQPIIPYEGLVFELTPEPRKWKQILFGLVAILENLIAPSPSNAWDVFHIYPKQTETERC